MVLTREEVLARGITERRLRELVHTGVWVRVQRGHYVDGSAWNELWAEGRQLLRVIAFARSSPNATFTHLSAAVLWGLPLYRVHAEDVHILIAGVRHARRAIGVMRHDLAVADHDIVERHGLRCTSLSRTILDLTRTLPPEAAVSAGDAALRAAAVKEHVQDAERAAMWREDLRRLAAPGMRGVRQVRWLIEFADGRAQLPGESVSRYQMYRLGFRDLDLQVSVTGASGDRYFLDFGFLRSRTFGEFDGEAKYLEPELRTAPTALDVVLAEKRREDDIRGVTGWGMIRWGHEHIRTVDALGDRLAAFGIHPPG